MSKSQKLTRRQIKDLVVANAMRSEAYRTGLLADPKAMVEKQLGRLLPENFKVELLYEDADTLYVVLPPTFPEDEDWEEEGAGQSVQPPKADLTEVVSHHNESLPGHYQRHEQEWQTPEIEDVHLLSEADLEHIAGGFAETHVNSCLGSGSMTSNA